MSTRVVIVGSGVAGLEAALALDDLAGDRADVLMLSPDDTFEVRALSVRDPFGMPRAQRHPLAEIAADVGFELHRSALAEVDPGRRFARATDGAELGYDALLVAVGAKPVPAFPHTVTFAGPRDADAVAGVLQDMEEGYARRIGFVAPGGATWVLPLYELALLTAERAASLGLDDVSLVVVTPESSPLELFGTEASAAVAGLLAERGIDIIADTYVEPGARTPALSAGPHHDLVAVDRVVSLPVLTGPHVAGLPADAAGFIPVDRNCGVPGAEGVWAAGDGVAFPIKQGGLATQQADAAAEAIAASAGAGVEPHGFHPVLRGMLLTGAGPRWLKHAVAGGGGPSLLAEHALWWPPSKVAGRYLAPYLFEREEDRDLAAAPPLDAGVPVDVDLTERQIPGRTARRRAVLAGAESPDGHLELLAYATPEES